MTHKLDGQDNSDRNDSHTHGSHTLDTHQIQSVARVSLSAHARIDKEGEQEQDAEEGTTIGPFTAHGRAYRMVADEQDTATAHQDTPTAFRVPWMPRHVRKRELP